MQRLYWESVIQR